jgi:hypothetical protein
MFAASTNIAEIIALTVPIARAYYVTKIIEIWFERVLG